MDYVTGKPNPMEECVEKDGVKVYIDSRYDLAYGC